MGKQGNKVRKSINETSGVEPSTSRTSQQKNFNNNPNGIPNGQFNPMFNPSLFDALTQMAALSPYVPNLGNYHVNGKRYSMLCPSTHFSNVNFK